MKELKSAKFYPWPGLDNMEWWVSQGSLVFEARPSQPMGQVTPVFVDDGGIKLRYRAGWVRSSSNCGESYIRLGYYHTIKDAKQAVFTALGEWYGPNPISHRLDLPKYVFSKENPI